MSEVFNDPSLWHASTIVDSPPRSSSSFCSFSEQRAKRQINEIHSCEHCGRAVKRCIFMSGCTYECELALASFDAHRYDYVYNSVAMECMNVRREMPHIAPPLYFDTITPEEYWKRAADDLYRDDAMMSDFLQQRLRENHVDVTRDISKRRR